MSKGYTRLPLFPGRATSENESKFRFSVRTPTSETRSPVTPNTFPGERNFTNMSGADEPLIPPQNGGFDDEDYLSEGNRQSYGSSKNEKSRRKGKGLCNQCWWYVCCGWKHCCSRQVTNLFAELMWILSTNQPGQKLHFKAN